MSQDNDSNMMRAKLRRALEKIGKTNGHACPETTNNMDPLLHELFIAAEAAAYFKMRHDDAKAQMIDIASEDIAAAVDSVMSLGAGTSITPISGDLYSMSVDIKKPAIRLDQRALRSHLQAKLGLSADQVEEAFKACSKQNAPAKTIKVASR